MEQGQERTTQKKTDVPVSQIFAPQNCDQKVTKFCSEKNLLVGEKKEPPPSRRTDGRVQPFLGNALVLGGTLLYSKLPPPWTYGVKIWGGPLFLFFLKNLTQNSKSFWGNFFVSWGQNSRFGGFGVLFVVKTVQSLCRIFLKSWDLFF